MKLFTPHRRLLGCLLLAALGVVGTASAQSANTYDPRLTFAPLSLPDPVNAYRSSNGAPGPAYWQNEADYELHAQLDTAAKALRTHEIITYTNNSPDTLPSLWIQLDQNIYRKDSRAREMTSADRKRRHPTPADQPQPSSDGYVLDSVTVESKGTAEKVGYLVSDTRMQVRLPEALRGHGSQIRIRIDYHYQIPGEWGDRTSWGTTTGSVDDKPGNLPTGDIYDMAQWFPRMCVYDDLRGWDTLPYIGSEFYLEYGNIDYYVTVPANMIVAGSGELMNPKEVLTSTEMQRLEEAKKSDKTIVIRGASEVSSPASRPESRADLTWHFRMEHTRDVAWSASPVFVWDAARINLPDDKTSLAMSFYPPESVGPNSKGEDAWAHSTEYVKDTVEHFSKQWYPYPWPAAINVAGFSTGMEYPGIVFDGIPDSGAFLFWVTAHEIGHDWFPMIVGSNERRHAFMDEGFNTFIDIDESATFAGGKYGPKRDGEYSAGGEPPDMILKVLDNPEAPTVLAPADSYTGALGHPVSYFKGAYGMVLLREQILGPQRFDWAFRKYIRDWAFKHPSPSDFFREMESEGGEDLSYFWRGWYMNNWKFDLAVDSIADNKVTISNLGQLVLPATFEVKFADGTSERHTLPVETWLSKGELVWAPESGKKIASVLVDPDHVLPDDNRSNNEKKAE